MTSIYRKTMALCVFCCLLSLSPALHAEETGMMNLGEAIGGMLSLTILAVPGAVFTGGSLTYIIKGDKSTSAWKWGGVVTGGLNLLVGTLWLVTTVDQLDNDVLIYLAIPHLVIGVLDLSFTIWASNLPEKKTEGSQLAICPTIFPDSEGRPTPGLALTLMGW